MKVLKYLYYIFENIILLHNLRINNFVIITPRFFAILFKKIVIFNKKKKNFFIQNIRNKFDINTVFQIFGYEEYNLKKVLNNYEFFLDSHINSKKKLIIDCGSNIGSSARYFSEMYYKSKIIAIEAEKQNYEFSKKNIIKNNTIIQNNAVSSSKQIFVIKRTNDPRAHMVSYKKVKKRSNSKQSIVINEIVKKYNNYNPFIIKIDIEGAEYDLFKKNVQWLNKFEIVIIEIHDWMMPNKAISSNFISSLSNTLKKNKRDLILQGENLISIKIKK
tara:strand:- start:2490 stop:3311 length:822 start_codon:yes stop_codon:yes gene_type:complete